MGKRGKRKNQVTIDVQQTNELSGACFVRQQAPRRHGLPLMKADHDIFDAASSDIPPSMDGLFRWLAFLFFLVNERVQLFAPFGQTDLLLSFIRLFSSGKRSEGREPNGKETRLFDYSSYCDRDGSYLPSSAVDTTISSDRGPAPIELYACTRIEYFVNFRRLCSIHSPNWPLFFIAFASTVL